MPRAIRFALTAILTVSCGGGDGPVVQGTQALSDTDGAFTLTGLVAGETTVRLEKAGYTTQGALLTLRPGDNFFSLGMADVAASRRP